MPFNINTFISDYKKNGYLQNNSFQVFIPSPPILQDSAINNNGTLIDPKAMTRELTFRAESFKAPGMILSDHNLVQRYGVGIPQKYPANARVTDGKLIFVSDKYGSLWQFWYHWVNGIFGFAGADNATGSTVVNSTASYQLEYKSKYAVTITVLVYNKTGKVAQTINLYNCYPTALQDVPLSWSNQELMKLTVDITFRDFSIQGAGTVH